MDLKDRFTPARSLISKIVHKGCQADASATEETKMDGCLSWFQDGLCPIDRPTTTHEHQGYHMDLKDRLAPAASLTRKIVHKGRQTDASAAEKLHDGIHHAGQYSRGTFETKR